MNTFDDSVFAYPGQRKYPLYTKEAALKSFKTFVAEKDKYTPALLSDIVSNFTKAAAFYDLKLQRLVKLAEECGEKECDEEKCDKEECDKEECGEKGCSEKECDEEKCDKEECDEDKCDEEECDDEDWDDMDDVAPVKDLSVTLYADNGETMRCSKIDTEESLNGAIAKLKELDGELPPYMIQALAGYILSSAVDLGVELPEEDQLLIEEAAGAGVGDKEDIEEELLKRASLIEMDKKSHSALYKYASELRALPDEEFLKRETLTKMCSLLTDIDNNFQLTGYYGKKLTEPRKVCFGDTASQLLKQASDMLFLPEIGAVLSKKALLERTDRVNDFFYHTFGETQPVTGNKLLIKVANTRGTALKALLSTIM